MNPPDPVETVMTVLVNPSRWPKMFPTDKTMAAKYWIAHQEPADENTERVVSENGGWKTPYHDRLVANLRTFLRLYSANQAYLIEHIERGVPWRGDEIPMYQKIVAETEKMLRDKPGYIEKAFTVLKSFRFAV